MVSSTSRILVFCTTHPRESECASRCSVKKSRGQNSREQEKVEVDGTETLDEVMTLYSANAVGFEADWKLDEMAMLQRQDQALVEVNYLLKHQHMPPRSWSKDGSLRSYKRLYHQLHIRNGVLHREMYVALHGGREKRKKL